MGYFNKILGHFVKICIGQCTQVIQSRARGQLPWRNARRSNQSQKSGDSQNIFYLRRRHHWWRSRRCFRFTTFWITLLHYFFLICWEPGPKFYFITLRYFNRATVNKISQYLVRGIKMYIKKWGSRLI